MYKYFCIHITTYAYTSNSYLEPIPLIISIDPKNRDTATKSNNYVTVPDMVQSAPAANNFPILINLALIDGSAFRISYRSCS